MEKENERCVSWAEKEGAQIKEKYYEMLVQQNTVERGEKPPDKNRQ